MLGLALLILLCAQIAPVSPDETSLSGSRYEQDKLAYYAWVESHRSQARRPASQPGPDCLFRLAHKTQAQAGLPGYRFSLHACPPEGGSSPEGEGWPAAVERLSAAQCARCRDGEEFGPVLRSAVTPGFERCVRPGDGTLASETQSLASQHAQWRDTTRCRNRNYRTWLQRAPEEEISEHCRFTLRAPTRHPLDIVRGRTASVPCPVFLSLPRAGDPRHGGELAEPAETWWPPAVRAKCWPCSFYWEELQSR